MARHSDRNFYLKFPADAFQRETKKAKCFRLGNSDVWIPKSQIVYEDTQDGETSITLPEWIVIEKGIESFADQDWLDAGEPE